ncbi:PLP-dependent aminotransferase family protein [Microbacterium sp. cf332]|uniref:MocR-like transcription factor YczR n=1 Tax=Microbacterium sp. cf332 TaxID=1761804 RepID=UPI00088BBEDC|nr:PLP-dependent aminotransferase family protein [Microbacterium sp. cf332]SDQ10175.1 DNA-binding transcriptional regulator, MocR family, contains an aminotransferase domain [Microbacterium sp. cf332]
MHSRISARSLETALGGWRTREPAYEALADGIRLLCLDNRIAARTLLPAERLLAQTLAVSRTTVASAYASLRASGHIESVRGSGSVTTAQPLRGGGTVFAEPGSIDLQQASPSAWPGLAGVFTETAAEAATLVSRTGYDTLGSRRLREVIAQRYEARGIPTSAEEVLVTAGAQSAIHLIAEVLVARGDRVLAETPTYPHAAEALRAAGARLVAVPVTTADGWDLDRLREASQRTRPTLAYLMPTFQNPTGRSMTDREQDAFRDAARRGCTLVVDETTAELHFERPAPVAFAPDEVIRLGSLGKTVWGGLRVGWIRARPDVIRRLHAARPARDLGTPEFEQAVASRLVERMSEILPQRAELLSAGYRAARAALQHRLPEWEVPEVSGGVALWVGLPAPLSAPLVLGARAEAVYLSAGPRFAVDGGHENRLRVPFTAPPAEIGRAVDVLAGVWERVRAGVPTAGPAPVDVLV